MQSYRSKREANKIGFYTIFGGMIHELQKNFNKNNSADHSIHLLVFLKLLNIILILNV